MHIHRTLAIAAIAGLVLAGMAREGAAQGNGTVLGVVRSEAGEPLPDVLIHAGGRSRLTDAEGRFLLHLPPGRQRLEVAHVGYLHATRELDLPRSGEPVRVEITLVATPLSLPGVQVTATPGGRQVFSTARSTTTLSGSALERNLGQTVAHTLEALPGLSVRYNGPAAAAPIIRGLTGDRILVLQDGQRVSDLAGSADDHFVSVDPLSAQRIEIVRGPASLLYGTNALGGVVNVISGDIPDRTSARAQLAGSLQAESAFPGGSAGVRSLLPLSGGWTLAFRSSARSSGDVRIGGDPALGERLENTFQRSAGGALGAGYAGERARGGLLLQGFGTAYGLPMPPDEHDSVELHGRKLEASGRLELVLDRGSLRSLRIGAAATDYGHDELVNGTRAMAFALRTQTLDMVLEQGAVGILGEGAFGAAGLFRQYAATGVDQLIPPADSRSLGVFAYRDIPLARERVSLQVGGRLDTYRIASRSDPSFGPGAERAFTAFTGSAGILTPFAEGFAAWVSAARSFRAPTVEELFSDALHLGTASYEIGDASLAPEYARGLELGLRAARTRWTAELAVYRKDIQDFIYLEERGDTTLAEVTWPMLRYVQQPALFTGAEASAEWVIATGWVASVQGDLVHARRRDGVAVPFLPPARVSGLVRWERGPISIGAGVRHAFRQGADGLAGAPSTAAYTLLDVDAGIRLVRGGRMHSLTLRGRNVTDVLYRDAASRIKDFAPNPGRNLTVLYRFVL